MSSKTRLLSTGLAIFSMFFGAGNLIFAVNLGREFQSQTPLALFGFLITAVLLPIMGVLSMVYCEGSYHTFFDRIGKRSGLILSFFCYLIIGPLVAMPRIITLSFSMFEPYLPSINISGFALFFIILTFALSVRENQILEILGKLISPLLILAILITVVLGLFFTPGSLETLNISSSKIISTNLRYGYSTLDFLTSMYFASIVITILKKASPNSTQNLSRFALKASVIGMAILGLVYICLATLGAYHSNSILNSNPAEILSQVFLKILGPNGALIMATVIFLACLSTIIALSALSAEYIREEFNLSDKLSYKNALIIILIFSGLISIIGLSDILLYSQPLINIAHPLAVALALVHIIDQKERVPYVQPIFLGLLIASIFSQMS